jgi:hypothetical protein
MIAIQTDRRPRTRRGFGLVEMAMTGVLIAAGMAATLQVVSWVALSRRAVERRERAVVEASNLMERICARPWEEITTESLGTLRLSEAASAFLVASSLNVKVEPIEANPARKKITLEIRWRDRSGRTEAPVRLIAWAFRREGTKS